MRGARNEKGTTIMKLTTTTQVSVNGVMQGNGGRHPDIDPGFERGGWARPLFDNEAMTFVDQVYQRADAFLFGRRTYEVFAGYWGVMDPGSGPIADALNTRPKYVASNTLTEPRWADTTVLSGDLAAAIGELKAKPGGELQVHGSGNLVRWLLDNQLVNEITLLVCRDGDRRRRPHRRSASRRGRRTRAACASPVHCGPRAKPRSTPPRRPGLRTSRPKASRTRGGRRLSPNVRDRHR